MDNDISNKQKNAAAIMLMQRVLEIYSEKEAISLDEALMRFSNTPIYNALFDFETGLWMEGPDYILDLIKRENISI